MYAWGQVNIMTIFEMVKLRCYLVDSHLIKLCHPQALLIQMFISKWKAFNIGQCYGEPSRKAATGSYIGLPTQLPMH